jgi:hypothetical protein
MTREFGGRDMGLDKIAEIVTTQQALIALIVMTCFAAIEGGFIGGLISRVGSIKKLFRMMLTISDNPANDTSEKRCPTTHNPDKQKRLKY